MTAAISPIVTHSEAATFESQLPKMKGRILTNSRVVRDVWSDGQVTFRCVDCGYTRSTYRSVVPHLISHQTPKKATAPSVADRLTSLAADLLTVANVIVDGEQSSALAAERDEWKRRAKDAERRLASLRRALGAQ